MDDLVIAVRGTCGAPSDDAKTDDCVILLTGRALSAGATVSVANTVEAVILDQDARFLPEQIAYLTAKADGRTEAQRSAASAADDASRRVVRELLKMPCNSSCADCTCALPDLASAWAVLPHGIFVCLDCAQTHRSLGTHISKVKGCQLDLWFEDELSVVRACGNSVAALAVEPLRMPKLAADAIPEMKREAALAKYGGSRRLDWVAAKEAAEAGMVARSPPITAKARLPSVQDQVIDLTARVTALEEHTGILAFPTPSEEQAKPKQEEAAVAAIAAPLAATDTTKKVKTKGKTGEDVDFFAGFGL